MNIGLAMASGELVCAVDADTLADPDAIALLVQPFLKDDRVVASGGTIRVANGCRVDHGRVVEDRPPRGFLARVQEAEYVRAFVFGRLGWNRLGGNVLISGAFGLFRTDAFRAVGGYRTGSIGEDLELVLALRRWGHDHGGPDRIEMVPDAVAWTEVPADGRSLGRQRSRWQAGLLLALWRYRGLLGRPRYGSMGTFGLPCYVVFELLAPVVELLGLVLIVAGLATSTLGGVEVVMFATLAYGLALVVGLWALVLDAWVDPGRRSGREWASRAATLAAEQVGFRPLTLWWRLRGLVETLGGPPAWEEQVRTGFGDLSAAPAARFTGIGPSAG
ncbi:MAG: glycosyltransferase family 2 protein [Actinobacteria bacterium]|nr:glycosyltransferase family 2 protein [Actinomycetota bacterium]